MGLCNAPVSAYSFSSSSFSGVSSMIGIGPLIFRFPFLMASAFQLDRCNVLCPLMFAATNPSRVSMWCGRFCFKRGSSYDGDRPQDRCSNVMRV